MAGTGYILIKNAFADDTTRSLKLGPFDESDTAIVNAKANLKALDAAAISDTYLSESGANFASVAAGAVVITTETEINLN